MATLSRHPAYTDDLFWSPDQGRPLHIELGEWADLLVLAPLTANTLGKLACGLADNLLDQHSAGLNLSYSAGPGHEYGHVAAAGGAA